MGDFVTFLAALLLLMPPLRNLAGVNSGFVMMAVAAESIFATLDEADETDEGKVDLTTCKGDFVFEHVSMRYPNTKRDAVHEFNLEVKAGDCIALVGLSGSGKSTLVHMIPRFWNPTKRSDLTGRYRHSGLEAGVASQAHCHRLAGRHAF